MTARLLPTGRQLRRSALLLFAAVALATACLDPTGEPSIVGELRVRPVYPTGMEPAALRIQLDSVWAVVRRSISDQVVVDRVRPSSGDDGELRWVIDLADPKETVRVSLELRSGLDPMYAGAADAAVQEGPLGQAELHDIPVDYVGPTPRAASVEVIPSRVAMRAVGQRRTVRAVVLDQAGDTVFRPVTWTAADPGVATVDAAGEVTAAASGSAHVIAEIDGLADSAVVIVDTALARSSTITADSTSMVADGVSASLVTVRVLDGSGSPVTASAGTVTLSATLGTIDPVPATDHGDGTYTATLTAATTTGLAMVNGTLAGATIGDTAGVQMRPGPPDLAAATTITADSASIVADGASSTAVRVEVRDATGNLVGASAGPVVLSATLGTIDPVPATDHGDGTYTATLTSEATLGLAVVSGTVNGSAITDTAGVTFRPGPVDATTTTITADSASIVADGASSTIVRVELRDAAGSLVGASAGPVTMSSTLGTIDPVPATDHGDGTYTATLTASTTTGLAVVSGTLAGAAIQDTAGVELRPSPVDLTTNTTITADSASIVADGVSSTAVRVEVRDAFGNLVGASAGPVTLTSTLGTIDPVPATDHGDGTYTATLTSEATKGLAVVSGTVNGSAITDTAGVTFRPGPVDLTVTTTITADSASLVADGVSSTAVRVELRDAGGNLVGASAGPVTLSSTLGTIEPVPAADHGDGTYTATLTAATTTGLAEVSGTLAGAAITDTAGVELRQGPVDLTTTTITADSASIVADGAASTTVRVELRDAGGNLVGASAGPVTLTTTLGAVSPLPATDHGDGTYTATLTAGTTTGLAVVSGTLAGAAIQDTAGVDLRAGPVDLSTTTLTADSASLVADGASTTAVRVELRDAGGNLVGASAGPVTLTSTLGAVSPVPATDHGDGTYTATLTAGTTTGLAVVSGTLAGAAITDTAGVELRPRPGDPTTTTITADSAWLFLAKPPTGEPEDDTGDTAVEEPASTIVTVRVFDALGDPLTISAGTVTLATTLGTLGPVTDHQDGTYTATLTVGTEPGTAVVTGTLAGHPIDDTATVEFESWRP